VHTQAKLGSNFNELSDFKSNVGYQLPQSGRSSGHCFTEKHYIEESKYVA
jgi:hypothetical protein